MFSLWQENQALALQQWPLQPHIIEQLQDIPESHRNQLEACTPCWESAYKAKADVRGGLAVLP